MTSSLQNALNLAAAGFKVFPLEPNSKEPMKGASWPKIATTDATKIERLWRDAVFGLEHEWGVGIATGDGLVVVDVDTKNDGPAELSRLEFVEGDIAKTAVVETPSGGRHIYLRTSQPIANSASKIAKGIDIRGDGGYVVGPGTEIDGVLYRGEVEVSKLSPIPEWLALKAGSPKLRDANADVPLAELDRPETINRAVEYLLSAEPAVEGAGGDEHTFKTAARLKDFGVSEGRAYELMAEHWNDRCSPPWDPEDLQGKVSHAYSYGKNPPGSADPMADFEVVSNGEAATVAQTSNRPPLQFELAKDIRFRAESAGLVKGLLDQGTFSVFYGESNVGKSFVEFSLGWAIASKAKEWFGHKIKKHGAVVYVASEGGLANRNRVEALKMHAQAGDVPFALVSSPINLLEKKSDTSRIVELVKAVEDATGEAVVFIVIDTLARAVAGGNESSSEDMGAFIRNVDRIRNETGAHVSVVHHMGKDKSRGMRGWSGIRAAIDTEIEVKERKISISKQRDMPTGMPVGFELKNYVLGKDEEGDEVVSCVAVPASLSASADFPALKLKGDQEALLQCLHKVIDEAGLSPEDVDDPAVFGRCVKIDDLRGRWYEIKGVESRTDGDKAYVAAKKSFQRAWGHLRDKAIAGESGGFVWVQAPGDIDRDN